MTKWSYVKAAFVCLFLFSPTTSYSQPDDEKIPSNAHARSYGSGWECDPSFRRDRNGCTAVIVPENAYPTGRSYGSGWDCLHGYQDNGGKTCIEVTVPDGAYLDPSGERWKCQRGYKKNYNRCEKVPVPEHAYLASSSYGAPWLCERGYRVFGDACVKVIVPKHGYLNDISFGSGWTCERGYVASGGRCDVVALPKNAHLDRSGNGWDCNKNYRRSQNQCAWVE